MQLEEGLLFLALYIIYWRFLTFINHPTRNHKKITLIEVIRQRVHERCIARFHDKLGRKRESIPPQGEFSRCTRDELIEDLTGVIVLRGGRRGGGG